VPALVHAAVRSTKTSKRFARDIGTCEGLRQTVAVDKYKSSANSRTFTPDPDTVVDDPDTNSAQFLFSDLDL